MKQIFVLLLLLVCGRINAQFIIAGQYSVTDCHYDYVPDTLIMAGCSGSPGPGYSPTYSMDINCDNIYDCYVSANCFQSLGGSYGSSYIVPLNGAEIAFDKTDTCYDITSSGICAVRSYPKAFNSLDTIGVKSIWKKNIAFYLSYYIYTSGACGCNRGTFSTPSNYIGIRMLNSMDTIYGWIKLRNVNGQQITIEERSSNVNKCKYVPAISAMGSSTLICLGETSTLTASGASTYTWSTGANGPSIVVTPSVNTTYTVNGTYANGCTNSFVITQSVDACIGIDEYNNSHSLKPYPNPTKDKLEFVLSGQSSDLEIRLYNSLGQIVLEDKMVNSIKFTLDVSNYAKGLYYVEVESKEGISRAKFVKN